ncbi:glycosyltransferase family 4 protein [uncultured Paracoccus sp.]|uniref:glycosyltransferase family 4 protein n=1 Tax=uncultured Paracoccus sp. TaxID=189685 RepID=UPI0025E86C7B|nr:glycosyltransferase family 4 protein [uncultured Paracoccus sp.]
MTSQRHDPSILIVAPNVSARMGGEAFLPLNYFRLLSQRGYRVHLIAHERNRAELLAMEGNDPSKMHFVPNTAWHRFFSRHTRRLHILNGMMLIVNDHYQARLIKKIVAQENIDVIHQPTPVSPRFPSSLHRFGPPLVIGPMNGGIDYPPGYEGYENRWRQMMIMVGRKAAHAMNHVKRGKLKAKLLLVANERTRTILPNPHHPGIRTVVENGVDFERWNLPDMGRAAPEPGRLRLAFMGRLAGWKAVDITLEAVAIARNRGVDLALDIVGSGEEEENLKALARQMNVAPYVNFHGYRPQEECAAIVGKADALVLNSLKECGGAVILEAMAIGLPVVASAWGGPLDYITDESGILVHPTPRETFAERLSDAFETLARDVDLRQRMGREGKRIVAEKFDWHQKIERITSLYDEALRR